MARKIFDVGENRAVIVMYKGEEFYSAPFMVPNDLELIADVESSQTKTGIIPKVDIVAFVEGFHISGCACYHMISARVDRKSEGAHGLTLAAAKKWPRLRAALIHAKMPTTHAHGVFDGGVLTYWDEMAVLNYSTYGSTGWIILRRNISIYLSALPPYKDRLSRRKRKRNQGSDAQNPFFSPYDDIEFDPEPKALCPESSPGRLFSLMSKWMNNNAGVHAASFRANHAKNLHKKGKDEVEVIDQIGVRKNTNDTILQEFGLSALTICKEIEAACVEMIAMEQETVASDGTLSKESYEWILKTVAEKRTLPTDVIERHILMYANGAYSTLPVFYYGTGPMHSTGYAAD